MYRQLSRIGMIAAIAVIAISCVQTPDGGTSVLGIPDPTGEPFVAFSIIERTFTAGKSVETHRYAPIDLTRTGIAIDFNGDGRADPVAGYGTDSTDDTPNKAVVQILLSQGPAGFVSPRSLTLDKPGERGSPCPEMSNLRDVAVGDIDGDGRLDIIVASESRQACDGGLFYLHHPKGMHPEGRPLETSDLRYWDINKIDASGDLADADSEQLANLITRAIPLGCTIDDFLIEIEQGFADVELADMDFDGDLDIVSAQYIKITLTPLPGACTDDTIVVTSGQIAMFFNPGNDAAGFGWTTSALGIHERFGAETEVDRAGSSGLFVVDLDDDGDFDIISSARLDNNVQVSWFENPLVPSPLPARSCGQSGEITNRDEWCQWRIGAIRDAFSVDVGDMTGDGKLDVVATGKLQKQVMLFAQPASGPKREFDWDTFVVARFDNLEPIDVHIADIDGDGTNELVIGATEGAVRAFDPPSDATKEWTPRIIYTFQKQDSSGASQTTDPNAVSVETTGVGEVGLLGLVDLDDDGDFDLVTVLDGEDGSGNDDLIAWIRNDS